MRRSLTALAAVSLLLAGCGGGDDSAESASGDSDAPAEITIGTIPNADVAPIYLGDKQGFFADRGLTLTFAQAQGGAAIVPAVVSGENQFGTTNMTTLLQAGAQGLPLKLVAPGSGSTGKEGEDFGAVIVSADSPIQTAADLAGKKVAINTINNINDTVVREAVRQDDGDPEDLQFVELGFPDMVSAVATGNVDAAMVVEPFLSIAKAQGLREVAWPYAVTAPDLSIAGWFTSQQYIDSNPGVVSRFQEAIKESADYAREHPDEVRAILSTYTSIDPALTATMTLPNYQTEINRDALQTLLDLGKDDGIIDGDVDVDDVLAE